MPRPNRIEPAVEPKLRKYILDASLFRDNASETATPVTAPEVKKSFWQSDFALGTESLLLKKYDVAVLSQTSLKVSPGRASGPFSFAACRMISISAPSLTPADPS